MISCLCATADQTVAAGRRLGARLRPGDVLLLSGDLGAGKTTFAQGVAQGYGITAPVTSPSFALIHEHGASGRRLVHFDAYRITDPRALMDLGWASYLGGPDVMVIEWPERLGNAVPSPHVRVTLEVRGDDTRVISLTTTPPSLAQRFEGVWP